MRKPDGRSWPWDLQRTVAADKRMKLEVLGTERALLNYLIARLHSIDADVLVGHNVAAYDMAVLLQRLSHCKVAHWSKIGRMRIKNMPKLSGTGSAFSGSNWAEWCAWLGMGVGLSVGVRVSNGVRVKGDRGGGGAAGPLTCDFTSPHAG